MKKSDLKAERRVVDKLSYYPSRVRIRELLDSNLEALDEIERLKGEVDRLKKCSRPLGIWSTAPFLKDDDAR